MFRHDRFVSMNDQKDIILQVIGQEHLTEFDIVGQYLDCYEDGIVFILLKGHIVRKFLTVRDGDATFELDGSAEPIAVANRLALRLSADTAEAYFRFFWMFVNGGVDLVERIDQIMDPGELVADQDFISCLKPIEVTCAADRFVCEASMVFDMDQLIHAQFLVEKDEAMKCIGGTIMGQFGKPVLH